KPGATNRADALSRRPDYEGPNPVNEDVTVWPDHYFCNDHTSIRVFDMDSIGDNLDAKIKLAQYKEQPLMKKWAPTHNLSLLDGTHWYHGTALVVVADNELRRGGTSLFHDHVTTGHPGITKKLQFSHPNYWPSRKYQNTPTPLPILLVAQHENLCYRIRQGMRNLPNDQSQHSPSPS